MKCSAFPKGEKTLVILLTIIFLGGFLMELHEILTVNNDWEHWICTAAFLAGAIFCIIAYSIGLKSCIIVDENGITFSQPFQKSHGFLWKDIRFIAKYYVPHSIRGVWGILFSFDIDEYDIKGNIKYRELLVTDKKSDRFCTLTYYSEDVEKALKKYAPYSKLVRKELQYEDFGFE